MSIKIPECLICYCPFDDTTRKPCFGTCGHHICELCTHSLTTTKCFLCNREDAFLKTTINYGVLAMIQGINAENNRRIETLERNCEKCSECGLQSRKFWNCVNCGIESGILKSDGNSYWLNTSDYSEAKAFSEAKKTAVCGDCALDGLHRKHTFINFEVLKETQKQTTNCHQTSRQQIVIKHKLPSKHKKSSPANEFSKLGKIFRKRSAPPIEALR